VRFERVQNWKVSRAPHKVEPQNEGRKGGGNFGWLKCVSNRDSGSPEVKGRPASYRTFLLLFCADYRPSKKWGALSRKDVSGGGVLVKPGVEGVPYAWASQVSSGMENLDLRGLLKKPYGFSKSR